MKKILTVTLLVIGCHAFAQQDSLKAYNAGRVHITSSGMEVLGSWGIVNTFGGGLAWATSTSAETHYFFQMNTIWGSANFVTAILGYTGTQNNKNKKLTASQTLHAQEKIEKIFKINSYIDVGYLGAGLYLKLAGDSRNSPLMKGYGEAVLMQGGFLLIFDQLMYRAEKNHGDKLRNFLEKHPISFDGRRVGIIFNM
jgi:hypothetical protein